MHQSFVYCAAHNVVAGMKFGEGTRELSASKELVDIFLRAAYLSQGDQDEAATNKQFDSVVKDFKEEIATQDKDVLEDIKQLDEVCAQLSDFAVKLIDDAKARKQDADEMEIDEEALTKAT